MENVKYIRDSLYGNIELRGVMLELMETPEMQRLHGIKQLGLANLVFPGANHTRLEHSLGTGHVARKMHARLRDDADEGVLISVAALLHDVGHGPFSHTLEYLMHEINGKDHVEITKEIITGKRLLPDIEYDKTLPEILSHYGIEAREIVDILDGKKGYLSEIISGALDADQMDYLMRDAYYTGVAYGIIDSDRIIQTMRLHDGRIVFERKGVTAIESMLVARAIMYSSVYLHKTVRIAELMLVKAVEMAEPFDFSYMVDSELMERLKSMGGYQREIALRLKYRRLFKKAFAKTFDELDEREREIIAEMNAEEIEEEIGRKIGKEGYVIVDIPGKDIMLSEPRLKKTDLKIFDEGRIRSIKDYTPLSEALQVRGITEWAIMIASPEEYRDAVKKEAESLFAK